MPFPPHSLLRFPPHSRPCQSGLTSPPSAIPAPAHAHLVAAHSLPPPPPIPGNGDGIRPAISRTWWQHSRSLITSCAS
eukprot:366253-Chlamydomonas_euryale.AAC.3